MNMQIIKILGINRILYKYNSSNERNRCMKMCRIIYLFCGTSQLLSCYRLYLTVIKIILTGAYYLTFLSFF